MYKKLAIMSVLVTTTILLNGCGSVKNTETDITSNTQTGTIAIDSWIVTSGSVVETTNEQPKPMDTSIKPGQTVDKTTACGLADGEYPNQLSINWPGNSKITSIWLHGLWFIKKWITLFYVVNVISDYDETGEIHLYKYNCVTKKSTPLNKENLAIPYSKGAILWSNNEWFFFQIYIGDSYGTWNDATVSYKDEKIKSFNVNTLAWYNKIQEKYSGGNDIYCHLDTAKSISCMAREEGFDDPVTKTFKFNPYTLSIEE